MNQQPIFTNKELNYLQKMLNERRAKELKRLNETYKQLYANQVNSQYTRSTTKTTGNFKEKARRKNYNNNANSFRNCL